MLIKRGFADLIILVGLTFLIGVGVLFMRLSLSNTENIIIQAHKIKARLLAQAGLEKALLILKERYLAGEYVWSYPEDTSVPPKELSGVLGDGQWKVTSVKILKELKLPSEKINRTFFDRKYMVGNNLYGRYDIYRIEATGFIPSSRTGARVIALVKMIREEVAY